VILLSEADPDLDADKSDADVVGSTVAAANAGFRVFHIPRGATPDDDPEALADVPAQDTREPTLWVGYIPTPERYAAVYAQAQARNLQLVNSPEQHRTALEFEHAWPRLRGLTPESLVLQDVAECDAAVAQLGLPLFVKGAVLSRKAHGWKACVATTPEELRERVGKLLALKSFSRKRAVVRKLVPLRQRGLVEGADFPKGASTASSCCTANPSPTATTGPSRILSVRWPVRTRVRCWRRRGRRRADSRCPTSRWISDSSRTARGSSSSREIRSSQG